MNTVLTFKLSPETPNAIVTFADDYAEFRAVMETAAEQGLFGPNVELRWLLTTGEPGDEPTEG